MSRDSLTPKTANPFSALLSALLWPKRYLKLALPHNLAAELRSTQFVEAYRSGTFPGPDWPDKTRADAERNLQHLRKSLLVSAWLTLLLVATGLAATVALGKVHPSLPADPGKIASTFGASLAAWGAIFQFRGLTPTWRGVFIHEVAHALAFKLLTVGGFAIALLGGLWWQ